MNLNGFTLQILHVSLPNGDSVVVENVYYERTYLNECITEKIVNFFCAMLDDASFNK